MFLRTATILLIVSAGDGKRLADLIFPPGTSFVVSLSQSATIVEEFAQGLVRAIELDFVYPVVAKVTKQPPKTIWVNPLKHTDRWRERFRRNEVLKERQRKNLRLQLAEALDRLGFDGRRCVVRFQCELKSLASSGSTVVEFLLILFRKRNLNCGGFHRLCPFSLLQIILNSQQLEEFSY